eukprot:gene3463-3734_t
MKVLRRSGRVGAPEANRLSRVVAVRVACAARKASPEALLFDCDGVLVDTERDGHRVSFNEAFKQKGLDHTWDVELYGQLLEIGGGKERMTKYFKDPGAQRALVAELHKLKTDLFMQLVETGAMPLRPGVKRLIEEAIAAGDIVPKKKPDPAIYLLAAQELGVDPARCVVVEDSRIGMMAAKSAGMVCVITKSSYTQNEDFGAADAVFDSIGEAGEERFSLGDLTQMVPVIV